MAYDKMALRSPIIDSADFVFLCCVDKDYERMVDWIREDEALKTADIRRVNKVYRNRHVRHQHYLGHVDLEKSRRSFYRGLND